MLTFNLAWGGGWSGGVEGVGVVKLTLEYVKDTFHIMVIHAKDLVS